MVVDLDSTMKDLISEHDLDQVALSQKKEEFLKQRPGSEADQVASSIGLGLREQELDNNILPDELLQQYPKRRHVPLLERLKGLVENARHKLAQIAGIEKVIRIRK